jgi:4-amino-4-deoxy-L-arabinose transferase-like glycosyltransferase
MFPDKKQRPFAVEPFVMWALILTLAIGFKAVLILQNRIDFNADEAIVALMGRHILQGERPIFFYGQAYMGSLDAYLVALAFRLFGETVLSIRIVQVLLYLLTVILSVRIAQLFFSSRRAGWLAGLLLAVPTVNFSLYTTASLGGYGEALLLGSLSL